MRCWGLESSGLKVDTKSLHEPKYLVGCSAMLRSC